MHTDPWPPLQEVLLWKPGLIREGSRYFADWFPGLAGLSVRSYFDRRTDTVLLQLRFRGEHDERVALDHWARQAGFIRFGDDWPYAKKMRFERAVWRFRASQGAEEYELSEFCAALERAAFRHSAHTAPSAGPRRLARGTHTELVREPSDIIIDIEEYPAVEMPALTLDEALDEDGIPITWESTSF